MLAPVRRISIEIEPQTWMVEHGGMIHKVRMSVDSGGYQVVQELMLSNSDFESRFDRMFEMLKHSLVHALEREARSSHKLESSDGEAQETDAAGLYAR